MKVNSQSRLSFRDEIISLNLKFASSDVGAFGGSRAWMNAFSLSVNQDAVAGTGEVLVDGCQVGIDDRARIGLSQSGRRNHTAAPVKMVTMASIRNNLKFCQKLRQC